VKASKRPIGVRLKRACRHCGLFIAAVMILHCLAAPARADDITPKDLQVIGRTLGFVEDATTGTLELGIVYVRNEPDSVRQAKTMQQMLGDGLSAGKLVLHPRLVAADELASLDHIGALFIVPAAAHVAAVAAAAAKRLHVPTLSTDVACAEAGQCVLAFRSDPSVEIVMSREAAAVAGVRFTPAFRMLVRQL
jgi:hypothetical protein